MTRTIRAEILATIRVLWSYEPSGNKPSDRADCHGGRQAHVEQSFKASWNGPQVSWQCQNEWPDGNEGLHTHDAFVVDEHRCKTEDRGRNNVRTSASEHRPC